MDLLRRQIEELEALDVRTTRRDDFDEFWRAAVTRCDETPLRAQGCARGSPFPGVEIRDLTFEGLDGSPIHAWLALPREAADRPVPAVVAFHGASGSRGVPAQRAHWLLAGCAVLAMDYRMQGGDTGSNTGFLGGPDPNWVSLGLDSPHNHFYYHVLTDGLRAIRVAKEEARIDSSRIALDGYSQGGGSALTLAALDPEVALCMADMPSACWIEKRIFDGTGGTGMCQEYLRAHPERVEDVCRVMSYFDNLNHAENIRCRTLVSCGLKDTSCPADCCYAACNKITAQKTIVPYPFTTHSGGGGRHLSLKLDTLRELFFPGSASMA
jgi:cephalosporin-C deacetylase